MLFYLPIVTERKNSKIISGSLSMLNVALKANLNAV